MPSYMHAKTHFFEYDVDGILEPADTSDTSFNSTKVCFTIGPACQDVDILCKILEAGATAARIDLTWGTLEFHKKSLENLQKAVKETRRLCAVMLDSQGREIFVKRKTFTGKDGWPYHEELYRIEEMQQVTLTGRDVPASNNVWPLNYNKLHEMVQKDDFIYVSRYLVTGADTASLYLKVVDVKGLDVICEAQSTADLDGLLTVYHLERDSYGMDENLQNDQPILSVRDEEHLTSLGEDYEVDFLCLSHTRCKADIHATRDLLDSIGLSNTKIVAKIESKYGLARFKGILSSSDGLIISRGNIGLDVPVEKITLIQKHIISACNLVGKPVLVTRVVDTMANTPRPTRAEATDVANAVLDGADGFLLGAETLRGLYPVETINMVFGISKQAEQYFDETMHFDYLMQEAVMAQAVGGSVGSRAESMTNLSMHSGTSYLDLTNSIKAMATFTAEGTQDEEKKEDVYTGSPYLSKLESIASSAVRAASKINASMLVVYTHSGKTARLVAKYRPRMPILTLVVPQLVSDTLSWKLEGRGTARQCLISRGLLPMLAAPRSSIDSVLEESVMAAATMGIVKQDDHVVCIQRIHEDFCLKIVSVNDLVGAFNRAAENIPSAKGVKPILDSVVE